MIIRDSNSPAQWSALRRALGGRGPQFVVRESLPEGSVAWSRERLPLVLISSDVRAALTTHLRLVPAPPLELEPMAEASP